MVQKILWTVVSMLLVDIDDLLRLHMENQANQPELKSKLSISSILVK